MDRITKVTVASRRSEKLGDSFFTFEMAVEANTENMTDEEKKEYVNKLYAYCNNKVDEQILEMAQSLQK
mgnify:FL=1|jgi:translation initiation factor 2 alpha subunit (eIF-2alpha)|nr:MAG TPA: hypothetical protein [Caudoviricetes sp.]